MATSAPEMPFERTLAKKAPHARLVKEMPKTVPISADEHAYAAGAQVDKENCAVCHGLPGQPQTAVAKGMFPKSPVLREGKGVTDDPAGETYWKVAGGIRMTGMPGFGNSLSSTQMWQVSLLLADAKAAESGEGQFGRGARGGESGREEVAGYPRLRDCYEFSRVTPGCV